MDRFPALRLILRLGRMGALVVALVATALVVGHAWPTWGAYALLLAPVTLVVVYFLAKSYVEIVQIISEMAH